MNPLREFDYLNVHAEIKAPIVEHDHINKGNGVN